MSTDRLAASGSTADTRRIWVVDDDRSVRFVLATALRDAGYTVDGFDSAAAALQAAPGLVFTSGHAVASAGPGQGRLAR